MAELTVANIKKTIRYFRKNGLAAAFYTAKERMAGGPYKSYTYTGLSEEALTRQRENGLMFSTRFSVLVPCYETNPVFLREMLLSVKNQTYHNWELIVADASESSVVEDAVHDFIQEFTEGRILYQRLPENKGIAENTNEALQYAKGQYVALLDHDDLYTPDALYEMAQAIQKSGNNAVLLYSDEDKTDETGKSFFDPHIKLDFNLDLLLSNNYICHLFVARTDLMKSLKFRGKFNGAQDYDITLRMVASILNKCNWDLQKAGQQVCHIPKVLYHWRCHSQSTAGNPDSKMYAYEAGYWALDDFMNEQGWSSVADHTDHLGFYREDYEQRDIWEERPGLGAIGGPVIRHGRIAGGAMDQNGTVLYQGLNRHYSGYMNRAVLMQDVEALDLRNLFVREELAKEFLNAPSLSKGAGIQDVHEIHSEDVRFEETDVKGIVRFCVREGDSLNDSLMLSELIREKGYYLLYDPKQKEK